MLPARTVEMEARRLLRKHGVNQAPVAVEEIARRSGIVVRRKPFEGEVSGVLYRSGDVPVIGVNALDALVRQRFTIAHEIGHFLLHEEALHVDRHYPEIVPVKSTVSPSRRFNRDKVSGQATDRREIEANGFAAALLMPKEFLDDDLKGVKPPLKARQVDGLAKRYRVSQQAMIFRLMNLGVPMESA